MPFKSRYSSSYLTYNYFSLNPMKWKIISYFFHFLIFWFSSNFSIQLPFFLLNYKSELYQIKLSHCLVNIDLGYVSASNIILCSKLKKGCCIIKYSFNPLMHGRFYQPKSKVLWEVVNIKMLIFYWASATKKVCSMGCL